ncbi:hypothetical protein FM107_02865 [Sphingobacterium sp. JB170]|nr:hypothetical protein FM107_02865 [Sphingobacterium sp. JB170]
MVSSLNRLIRQKQTANIRLNYAENYKQRKNLFCGYLAT